MRASLSIGNNIAEGFERNNKKEFAVFLRYAKGSCGEVRQMLYIAQEFGYISLEQAEKMRTSCVLLSIKLYKLYKSL